MSRTILALLLAAALTSGPALSARLPDGKLESDRAAPGPPSSLQDVPFQNSQENLLTVPVRLGEGGPYQFLVDTGSDHSAISRQLATSLRLPIGDVVEVHGVAGARSVETATIRGLQLAQSSIAAMQVPLLDRSAMGADGILGTDALKARRLMFDFETGIMSIMPSRSRDFVDEPGSLEVDGRERNGRLIISAAQIFDRPVTIIIDTGAQVTIGNQALRQILLRRGLLGAAKPAKLDSMVGGTISGDYVSVSEIVIEGVTLRNLAVVFAPVHTFEELKLDDKPALLLGMNALRAFKKVSIDFSTNQLRVVIP